MFAAREPTTAGTSVSSGGKKGLAHSFHGMPHRLMDFPSTLFILAGKDLQYFGGA